MSERTYKLIELVGTSQTSYEEAIQLAVKRAKDTLDDLAWFEVTEFRGGLQDGAVEYQVKIKVAFRLH